MERNLLYSYVNNGVNEFVFSGIKFADFIELIPNKISNMLILKGDFLSLKHLPALNLSVVESAVNIIKLSAEDLYNQGDFHFVDYEKTENAQNLSKEELFSLLYLAHTAAPLDSPFYDTLNNQYTYLSHDDGWWCKIYSRDERDMIELFVAKIVSMAECFLNEKLSATNADIKQKIYCYMQKGLLVDFGNIGKSKPLSIPMYITGEIENIDDIYNTKDYKKQYSFIGDFVFTDDAWRLCDN